MNSRHGYIIATLAAVLTLAATAVSAATSYMNNPTFPPALPAPAHAPPGNEPPAPPYVPPGDAAPATPVPGIVVDDRGNPLPPCRERGLNGVEVIRGTGCVP
jgi:hypothetical protein